MTLLPGQVLYSGVSNYIFGSHIGTDYATNTIRNTPAIQALCKSAGFTLLRCSIPNGSPDSYIDLTASAAAACGADMLVILDGKGGQTWAQHVVSYLGSRCKLYEYRNEPDLGGVSWQTYLSGWNSIIPACRAINSSAAFIGPALGVFSSYTTYLVPWLQGCNSSGVLPDGISFHIYPCTGQGSSSTCSTKSVNFSSAATKINTAVTGILGHTLPLCLTEWNIDANNPPQSYTQDSAYVNTWYQAAIDNMVSAGYAIANQFSFASGSANGQLDLVSTVSPYNVRAGYTTLKTKIAQYLGTAIGGGGGTGSVSNPMTFAFSNAAASLSTANKLYTKIGGTANTWKYTRVGTAVNWGQLLPQGTTGSWAASGSIGTQDNKGLLFDDTFMEGKQISAGTITANVRLNCARNGDANAQLGSITADIVVRLSKRASGGTHTTIITMTASNQTIPAGFTTFALAGSLGSAITFGPGDKLYADVWLKVLTNTNGWADLDFRLNRLSTDTTGLAGDINASFTVPSVQPITDATVTALSLYESSAVATVASTGDQLYVTSGSPATVAHYSRVGTATNYGEVCSQSTTGAWAASATIPPPTGKGFFLDSTVLDNKQIVAGNWIFKARLNAADSQDTHPQQGSFAADITMRAYKYTPDGATYTAIASSTLTGQTISSSFTTFTMPTVAADSVSFNPSDRLYVDIWPKITTNSNGSATADMRLNRLSTDTSGKTGDPETQITTPGYADIVLAGGGGEGGITITAAQITTNALKLFRDQLVNSIKFVAFGIGTGALSPNDVKLGSEFFRKAVSSTQQGVNPGEVLINVFLASGDVVGKSIREIGFFAGNTATSDANTGTMIARALFSTDNKTDLESFVFQLDLSYLLA